MEVKKVVLLMISVILVLSVIFVNMVPIYEDSKPALNSVFTKEEYEEWDHILQKQ